MPTSIDHARSYAPPCKADATDSCLTFRSLDESVLGGATTERGKRSRNEARSSVATTPSLTNFDWLDTIVDDMLVARTRGQPPSSSFASTITADTRLLSGFDTVLEGPAASLLRQVVLACSPMIDARHNVIATRLTVVPLRQHARLDARTLLRLLDEVWPVGAGAVSINVASQALLVDLLRSRPSTSLMIEVPSFMAADPTNMDTLLELAALGNILLLKGRPERQLPREVLCCFKWAIVDLADDRRIGEPATRPGRTIPFVQSGVRTMRELAASFERGAIAAIGWPIDEPMSVGAAPRPNMGVMLEIINRIDLGESVDAIERALLRDQVLAFELLRHINSPAFGLSAQAVSLGHGIRMLGVTQLRRWVAIMLQRGGDDNSLQPANFAALRRGLLMRELAVDARDPAVRRELFLCGWLSLLDRVFCRPMAELFGGIALPERVHKTLVDGRGPFAPLLELVQALESEAVEDIRAAADAVFVEPLEFNRALLRTQVIAGHLE